MGLKATHVRSPHCVAACWTPAIRPCCSQITPPSGAPVHWVSLRNLSQAISSQRCTRPRDSRSSYAAAAALATRRVPWRNWPLPTPKPGCASSSPPAAGAMPSSCRVWPRSPAFRLPFYPGWSGVDPASLPHNFFVVGETAHSALFPRMSVVVHHGGSGTTHSATRAGVPSVVVPFAADQFFWADRLLRLGVAAEPVGAGRARAAALARSIAFAESPGARSSAAALKERMVAENGVEMALSIIERLMSQPRR